MLQDFLDILNNALIITGSLGGIYSGWSWWRQRRREKQLDQPVTIRLVDAADLHLIHTLHIHPPRRSISRQEVLGLIGMIPTQGNQRFSCAYLSTQSFVDQLDAVFEGRSSVLDLRFTEAEASLFVLTP